MPTGSYSEEVISRLVSTTQLLEFEVGKNDQTSITNQRLIFVVPEVFVYNVVVPPPFITISSTINTNIIQINASNLLSPQITIRPLPPTTEGSTETFPHLNIS
jgi:hypothetical protein